MVKIDTKEIINILPEKVKEFLQIKNFDKLQEIRIRVNRPLIFSNWRKRRSD